MKLTGGKSRLPTIYPSHDRLPFRRSALTTNAVAAICMGLIWAVWHSPPFVCDLDQRVASQLFAHRGRCVHPDRVCIPFLGKSRARRNADTRYIQSIFSVHWPFPWRHSHSVPPLHRDAHRVRISCDGIDHCVAETEQLHSSVRVSARNAASTQSPEPGSRRPRQQNLIAQFLRVDSLYRSVLAEGVGDLPSSHIC
jgi:hypothetical protein